MSVAQEDEESLFSGLRRQLDDTRARHQQQLCNHEQQMADLHADHARLKNECERLKREHTLRLREVDAAQAEKVRIVSEIKRIAAQRDAVQIEYAAAVDDNAHLDAGEAMVSAELAGHGRLNRQLYFQKEKIAELEEKLRRAEDAHTASLEMEQAVASGLRERIGRLERRLRDKTGADRARSASVESEHEIAVLRAEAERLRRESVDARDALALEVKTSKAERRRAEKLAEQLRDAREEGSHWKQAAAERDRLRIELEAAKAEQLAAAAIRAERDSLKAELAKAKVAGDVDNGPRALQPVSPNTPLTPKRDSAQSNVQSPKSPLRDLVHTRKELAHTKSQHASLKAAHDELKDKYTKLTAKRDKERQHFKEFHAVYNAKKEAKRKRRELQLSSSAVASGGVPTPPGPVSQPSSVLASSTPAPVQAEVEVEENGDDRPPAKRARPSPPRAPVPDMPAEATPKPGPSRSVATPASVSDPLRRQPSISASTSSVRTPSTAGVTRQASRVTPWLGGNTRSTSSSRKLVRRDSFGSDDEAPSPASRSTPLVRDRMGASTTSEGLRLKALKRSIAPDAQSTPSASRKLDFEGMSPSERAAERKKLSRLSTAERREVYAPYKGKGRYVAPEDVKKTFADEYEIDPTKNDGVAHQYDAVVRSRDERRKMHGGDCECCRDYYEAVGDIPRFNSGPVWRDASPSRVPAAVDIEDHQNRVSRHREVWRRPPTPPDYWKIGFPTTQDVRDVNKRADEMVAQREAEVRREAAHKDSKWRKK